MSVKISQLISAWREMRGGHKRWSVLALLFMATVIMFVDRQSLSVLAPSIIADLHITEEQYSYVVMAFMISTGLAQLPLAPLLDKIGVRIGLGISFVVWTIGSALHAITTGAFSLMIYRVILGIGEAADIPASSKACAEWFPPKERAFAIGVFTGGTAIGALVTPPLMAVLATHFGWRIAFLLVPLLSTLWLIAWFRVYHSPKTHPSLSAEERELIARETVSTEAPVRDPARQKSRLWLLGNKCFWGIAISRMVTAPISAFGWYWLPLFLSQRYHLSLIEIGLVAWIPYLAQDIGSMLGGAFSGSLIKHGRSPAKARMITIGIGAVVMLALMASDSVTAWLAVALISATTFALGSYSANIFALSTDQFDSGDVATVVGWSQATLFLGGSTFTFFLGRYAAAGDYLPTLTAASGLALFGFVILMILNWKGQPRGDRSREHSLPA